MKCGFVISVCSCVYTALIAACPSDALAQSAPTVAYDTTVRSISLIRPGTVITNRPPQGWTHLIVKSLPKVASGDLDKVPERDVQLASLLFTALVARVQRDADGTFRLADFATGVGTRINGTDTIISGDTQKQLGANLGLLARMVLKEFDAKQKEVVFRARGRRFAIVDTMGAFRLNNQNRMLPLRYVVIVHPNSGRLDSFCWLMNADANGKSIDVASQLHWLPPSLFFSPQLHADSSQYNFMGIPSNTAFCTTNIPPGQLNLDIPPDARAAMALPAMQPQQVEKLHRWFSNITTAMSKHFAAAASGNQAAAAPVRQTSATQ